MGSFWIIRPLVLIAKLFGHWTFRYQEEGQLDYKSTTCRLIDRISSLIAVFLNVSILYAILSFGGTSASGTLFLTSIGSIAYPWTIRYSCFMVSAMISLNWLFRKWILRMLHQLDQCDALLAAVDLRMYSKPQRRCVLLANSIVGLTILVCATSSVICFYFYGAESNVAVVTLIIAYFEFSRQSFALVALFFIVAVWFRFRALNRGVYQHFFLGRDGGGAEEVSVEAKIPKITRDLPIKLICTPTTAAVKDHSSGAVVGANQRELVCRYANIHHSLCCIVDWFNSCQSFQVSVQSGIVETRLF